MAALAAPWSLPLPPTLSITGERHHAQGRFSATRWQAATSECLIAPTATSNTDALVLRSCLEHITHTHIYIVKEV